MSKGLEDTGLQTLGKGVVFSHCVRERETDLLGPPTVMRVSRSQHSRAWKEAMMEERGLSQWPS